MHKVLISSCLLGHKVRYDGQHSFIEHPLIKQWKTLNRIVAFCPEVAAGLPIPRPAVEIISQEPSLLADNQGNDYTAEFTRGAELALEKALSLNIQCAILKSKSPSCGRDNIYDGSFSAKLINGDGVTARLLQSKGIKVFNETELTLAEKYLNSLN